MTTSYIYVATRPDGAHKVGHSCKPNSRRTALSVELWQPVEMVAGRACERRHARAIEALAHEILQPDHVGGEWFFVDADTAIAAVEAAQASFAAGRRAQRTLTREVDIVHSMQPLWGYVRSKVDIEDEDDLRTSWRAVMGALHEMELLKESVSVKDIHKETGVSKALLYRWKGEL